jgi:hypothetical protein
VGFPTSGSASMTLRSCVRPAASAATGSPVHRASPKDSYFDGCSDGGREALIEAQHYPTDFNGIIAGSPASVQTELNAFEDSVDRLAQG